MRWFYAFFDLILSPFRTLSPVWALLLLSLLAGLFMLLIFRYTSDHQRVKETKNVIKAHFLELWLFRDDPWIMLSAQGQILRLNGRYLKLVLKPALVLIVPMTLFLMALDGWFASRPLHLGEEAIVAIQVGEEKTDLLERATLAASNGVTVETLPLRVPQTKELNWRIRAQTVGHHKISVNLPDQTVEKQVVVSQEFVRVSASRLSSALWQALFYPNESPLPPRAGLRQIDIYYPARSIQIFGWEIHWLVAFFILSTICAFAFRRIFGVEL